MLEPLEIDRNSLAAALQFARETGEAMAFGEAIGQAIREKLGPVEIVVRSAPPDVHEVAAMAMQGLLGQVDPGELIASGHDLSEMAGPLARASYRIAAAMLVERKRFEVGGLAPEWWCPSCQRVVDSTEVTFQDRHQTCGAPVTAPPYQEVAPAPAGQDASGIDWSDWKVCDQGYVLWIDDKFRYEIRPNGDGFDLYEIEVLPGNAGIALQLVSQAFSTVEKAMAAAREDWTRDPSKEIHP